MKRIWILPMALALVMITTGVWGYGQYKAKNDYHQNMENIYQKSFYDLIKSVENIEIDLSKLMVTGSPQQRMLILSDIWNKAIIAQNSLAQLPISHLALDRTASFITQVGDYSYFLTKETSYDRMFTEEEWSKLEELHNYVAELNKDLNKLESTIARDGIKWGELRQVARRGMESASDNVAGARFKTIEKNMVDYPELIYDGPFSEHIAMRKPQGLAGKVINIAQAKTKVIDFVGRNRVREVRKVGETHGSFFETYSIEVLLKDNDKGPIYVDITKKGGHVVWMITSDVREDKKLSVEQGSERAQKWLDEKGYKNMTPTYSETFNGLILVNFAYEQDDIIVYPDLIKVEVSLEDGETVGFEAAGYLMTHRKREIPEPEINEKEAEGFLSNRFKVESVRKSIIPTLGGEEKFCYEFKGKFDNETFLIYIDAKNGEEVRILKLITTDNGKLTI